MKKFFDIRKWRGNNSYLINECNCSDEKLPVEEEKYKHEGDFISTRDIYDYIQDKGLFNKDFKVQIDTGGQIEHPVTISGFRIENGKFIIETT